MRKMVVMLAAIGMVGSTFLPAQAATKVDPQAQAFLDKLTQAMDDHSAGEGMSLFTSSAVLVDPFGNVSTGRDAEKNFFDNAFKVRGNDKFAAMAIASHSNGNMMWILGKATWTPSAGAPDSKGVSTHNAYVLVRENNGWKAQMLSAGVNIPSPTGRYSPPAGSATH